MKTCTKCKIEKELSEFCKAKKNKDGLSSWCRTCTKAYRESHKEEIEAYKAAHKEEIKDYNKAYKSYHKEEIKAYQKAYHKTVAGKLSMKNSSLKYPNATESRKYYNRNKHNMIVQKACSICPSINRVEAHHCDYNKPMDVIYLCRQCHKDWHKNNTPLNRVTGIFTELKK